MKQIVSEDDYRNHLIGMAYRKNSAWFFKTIGKGSRASIIFQLADECIIFASKS